MEAKRVLAYVSSALGLGVLAIGFNVLQERAPGTSTIQSGSNVLSYNDIRSDVGAFINWSATADIKITYPKVVSPDESFQVDAEVRLKDLKVEDIRGRELSDDTRKYFEPMGRAVFEHFLRTGSAGLTLRLAGAQVQPDGPAPIVDSKASWSVKAAGKGTLKGFVSPLIAVAYKTMDGFARKNPSILGFTTTGTQPLEIAVRQPLPLVLWSGTVFVAGTLLTIPGLIAFIFDIRKRLDEREKRQEEKEKRQEEEWKADEEKRKAIEEAKAKEAHERKIILPP